VAPLAEKSLEDFFKAFFVSFSQSNSQSKEALRNTDAEIYNHEASTAFNVIGISDSYTMKV
jgi:hypothetical protein